MYIRAPISKFEVDTLICNPSAFPLRVPVSDLSIAGLSTDDVNMVWRYEDSIEYTLSPSDIFDSNKGDTAYVFNDYGSYSVKQIITNNTIGCVDSTEKTIVISQLIPDFIISSDTLCQTEPITITSTSLLTDGPGFFSFNLGNGVVKNGNPISYTYSNSGSYNITLKAFNSAGCVLTKAKNNLIIISTPSASFTASANDYQCLPLTNSYTNTSSNSSPIDHFLWTFPDGTTDTTYSVNETISFPYVTKGTLITSLITKDIYGCSSDTATHTVVITQPDMNFTMDSVYCNNEQITIPNNTIGFGDLSYEWKMDQIVFSTDTNFRKTFTETSTNQLYEDHSITLKVTDEKGCADSLDFDIKISLPQLKYGYIPSGASVNDNGEYLCPPVFGNFSDSSISYGNIINWNWTFGDGKSSNLQSPSNTYLYPGTYSVSFDMEDEFGCTNDTLLVDFIKILGPTVDASWVNTNNSCGNEFNFTAQNIQPLDSIYWNLDDNTIIFDSLDFLYSYNSGTFIPKAIVTDTIGCAVTYELPSITISSSSFTADAGQDILVCTDQTNLNATPKLGNSYTSLWSVFQGDIVVTDLNSPTYSVTNLGTSENILVWKISDGCTFVTDTVSVINGYSNVNAGPDDAICAYSYSPLSGNSPFVGTGAWSSTDNTITFDNPLDSLTTVSNLKDGNNELIWTINSICGVNSDRVVIFVETPPTTADAGQNDSICGTSYTLNGNTAIVGDGTWSLVSGTATISSPNSSTSSVTGIGRGENVFEWRIENNCNFTTSQVTIKGLEQPSVALCANDTTLCSDNYFLTADTISIEYIDAPSPAIVEDDQGLCIYETTINATPPIVGNGVWETLEGTGTLADAASPTTLVTNLAQGINVFKWTVSNVCGSNTDTLIVTSSIAPTEAIVGEDQTICGGLTILSGNEPTLGEGEWSVKKGEGFFHNNYDPTTGVDSVGIGENIYVWTISNACTSSKAEIVITNTGQCPDEDSLKRVLYYYVPNSFSPNGDALNNTFLPVFESGFEPTKYSLLIFNRWGQLIFESYNAEYGWNGRLMNDAEVVQEGLYPWIITFTDINTQTEKTLNGFVILVK